MIIFATNTYFMARIMALDYGQKRCGLATTDPLQIIAAPLTTVETKELMTFFEDYLKTEEVECLVIGEPTHKDGTATPLEIPIQKFMEEFAKKFPKIKLMRQDERFTSQQATEAIRFSVKSKKKRQDKALIDKISATIILQEFLGFN
jgi:putative Holliday junction resolvase